MRIATGGTDDSRVYFNAGPPFKRVVDGNPSEDVHVKGAVNCLKYTSSGSLLCSVGSDRTVSLYDGKTMAIINKLENVHFGSIYSCDWNSTDSHILTCSADGTCKLISADPLEVVHSWNVAELLAGSSLESVPIGGMLVGCCFSKNDIPVAVSINGELSILPKPPMLKSGVDNYRKLTGHVAPISGMAVDHSRGLIYTADSDGLLCQYSLATCKIVKRFAPPSDADLLGKMHGGATISCLTVLADGTVLTAGWDDAVRIVDIDGNVVEKSIALDAQPTSMASGTQLAIVVTVAGLVLIRNDSPVSSMIFLPYAALSVCISSDDSTIYVGGEDCKIHVYSVTSSDGLEQIHVIDDAHLKPVYVLCLSHDETKLASADVRDVCIWNVADNFEPIIGKSRWCFHTQRITCLTWSPDDTVLASGGADDAVYLWSLKKRMTRLHYPFSHRGGVTGLAFMRQGLHLVSVGADACVNQWDVSGDVSKKFG
jgi:WD40 repeat protein